MILLLFKNKIKTSLRNTDHSEKQGGALKDQRIRKIGKYAAKPLIRIIIAILRSAFPLWPCKVP